MNCSPLLSELNWARGDTSRFAVVHIFLTRMGPHYDINGEFINKLESKVSFEANMNCLELGLRHRVQSFGHVCSSWLAQSWVESSPLRCG